MEQLRQKPNSNILNFYLGFEAYGSKSKEIASRNWFLLFYSPKPPSEVRILIYRNWSIKLALISINKHKRSLLINVLTLSLITNHLRIVLLVLAVRDLSAVPRDGPLKKLLGDGNFSACGNLLHVHCLYRIILTTLTRDMMVSRL